MVTCIYIYEKMNYYVVPRNSDTYSDTSWNDVKNELKKAGSDFVEWLSSKVPKGSSKENPRCVSCHKNGTTIHFSRDVAFCSQKCHHEALQKYLKELGESCSFYLPKLHYSLYSELRPRSKFSLTENFYRSILLIL